MITARRAPPMMMSKIHERLGAWWLWSSVALSIGCLPEFSHAPEAPPDAGPADPAPSSLIDWVVLEGGDFVLGPGGEVARFEVSRSEVTMAQYRACVEARACTEPDDGWSCNWGRRIDMVREAYPINCVTWAQASAFAAWVGGRLPTEAEWEFAARSGGQEIAHPWGDEPATCAYAVMLEDSEGCGSDRAWAVCSKPEGNTAQGLCDMSGNVWEWVADVYEADGEEGERRVIRGGGWRSAVDDLRVTSRGGALADKRREYLGFRVAR